MSGMGLGLRPGDAPCDVAPDFASPIHYNTLAARPDYQLSLSIGKIEDLFADPPGSVPGRLARLQVLGLYYLPLGHVKEHVAYGVCWPHVKEKVFRVHGDAEADDVIQKALSNRVIGPTRAPFHKLNAIRGGLPPPASEPSRSTEGNFAKIRVPGGYTFLYTGGVDASLLNLDARCSTKFGFMDELWDLQKIVMQHNPVLGKIPIVAKVKQRRGTEWDPVPGAMVYFQLVIPYRLPPFRSNQACIKQYNRPDYRVPTPRPGPGKLVDARERLDSDAADPQNGNCLAQFAGKRRLGGGAAGTILLTQQTPGFHVAHPGKPGVPGRALPHAPFPPAEEAPGNRNSVRAQTNVDGEAGVIFSPSTKGGDRYRLRAFVGPPSQPVDGMEVAVETGTLVVWRNIRISQQLVQGVQEEKVAPVLLSQATSAPHNIRDAAQYQGRAWLYSKNQFTGLGKTDLFDPQKSKMRGDSIDRQFARAFCEIEADLGAEHPRALSQSEWERAVAASIAPFTPLTFVTQRVRGNNVNPVQKRIDLAKLFCRDLIPRDITVDTAICNLPMRTPAEYNRDPGTGDRFDIDPLNSQPVQSEKDEIDNLFWSRMAPVFMRELAGKGYLPGLTLVRAGLGMTWQVLALISRNSGLAVPFRGGFVWFGDALYTDPQSVPYGLPCNVSHEFGHCLFREHAPAPASSSVVADGANANEHDSVADAICVMSYEDSPGDFCGKCLLALRGWKIR